MSSIRLHPTKGVNPHLTICAWCRKDLSIALPGADDGVYECRSCNRTHLGRHPETCPCGAGGYGNFVKVRTLEEGEKLNIGELCDDCLKKKKEHDAEVARGGIYWKCERCGSAGVIKAEAPISQNVRKQTGIEPPKPCGVKLDRADCPACSGDVQPPTGV
jgi:hypothetical protein